jgi:hypothetical protein
MLKAIAGGGSVSIAGLARFGSGVPSNGLGSDGDGYIRFDSPYTGLQYSKASGTWAVAQAAVAWASRPSAASNPNGIITVSDLGNADFYSDGTNWIPINKRLLFVSANVASSSKVAGPGVLTTFATDTIPAGLVVPGCRIEFRCFVNFGGTGTIAKTIQVGAATANAIAAFPTSTHKSSALIESIYVSDSAQNFSFSLFNSVTQDSVGTSANDIQTFTDNYANAVSFVWKINAEAVETYQVMHRSITIFYK